MPHDTEMDLVNREMIVLTYHKINDVRNFEEQIKYLMTHGYSILSLGDFRDGYAQKRLKSKDILITFDDGDYSVLDRALPVLKKYEYPAAMFVITGLIGTQLPFWWDEISYYCEDKNEVRRAKMMDNNERLDLLKRLRSGTNLPPLHYRQLTWDELRFMDQEGISIANHSHTHPMFDRLSGTEIKHELETSVSLLARNKFRFCNIFAYPNGNHSSRVEEVLSALGIELAFLFDHKLNAVLDNPYRISRLSVNDTTPLWKFGLILKGWHSRIVPISKKLHKFISG